MIRISLLVLFPAALAAQNSMEVMSGSAGLNSGVWVRFHSVITWTGVRPANARGSAGGISGSADTIHRIVLDNTNGDWFGYDLMIVPDAAANGYLATFQAPSGKGPGGARLASPKFPASEAVRYGDTIQLDVMVSADGKQKLTDYLDILPHEPAPPAATTTASPVDFSLDDGPLTFKTPLTVWRQGVPQKPGFTGKPGATLALAVPNQGRYILTLLPHDGFVKAGAIRDNVVSFEDAGVAYEIRFMEPVAGADKAWNLYVMHDISFQAPGNQRDMVIVTTDRLANLLMKQ
jgi:hypothetical protein